MSKLLLKYEDRSFVYQVGEGGGGRGRGLVGLERRHEKNVALKGGFRRKKCWVYWGDTKNDFFNNSSSLPECHLRHKWVPHKKILMKRGVHHVLQELSVESH